MTVQVNLEAFRAGEQFAFKQVFDQIFPELRIWMLSKYKNMLREDIEDAIGEAFYLLYQYRLNMRCCDHINAFVFTVAKHRIIDIWRNKESTNVFKDEAPYSIEEVESPDHFAQIVEMENKRKLMWQTIERLPKQRRNVIQFILKGYNKFEIADILGIDSQTVLNHKTKAIADLAKRVRYGT